MAGNAHDLIRVLHVDDEPDLAELAATFLERIDDRLVVETETRAQDGLDRLFNSDDRFDRLCDWVRCQKTLLVAQLVASAIRTAISMRSTTGTRRTS